MESQYVKDYVQNREKYVNLGKGAGFSKAVSNMDAQLNGSHENVPMQKSNTIFVKVENDSDKIEIMKYNRPAVGNASINVSNDTVPRLLSELSDIRRKHNDGVYELEKSKEMVVNLTNEKQRLLQTIVKNNEAITSLSNQNKGLESQIAETERKMNVVHHESIIWKEEKKQLQSSMASYHEEKSAAIENAKSTMEENDRLRKQLAALQARLKQNVSGAEQNKRYFSETPPQETTNSYEVKQLIAHRKKNKQLEFKVQWKDTWVKECHLNCPKIQSAYWRKHK